MTMTSPCMHMDLARIHPRKHMRPGAPTFSNTCVGSVVPTRSLETSGNVERKAGTTALIAPVQINTYSKEKARLKLSTQKTNRCYLLYSPSKPLRTSRPAGTSDWILDLFFSAGFALHTKTNSCGERGGGAAVRSAKASKTGLLWAETAGRPHRQKAEC
jgi:hypothetical protein